MRKGFLHALQHDEQNLDLLFAPYGPNGTGGAMKPRRFHSREALATFLKDQIGAHDDAREDFLEQIASTRHGTMPEVWLTEEQRIQLRL
jgi:hypothetical protein